MRRLPAGIDSGCTAATGGWLIDRSPVNQRRPVSDPRPVAALRQLINGLIFGAW